MTSSSFPLPSSKTQETAFQLAREQDKPILLDYWDSSFTCSFIGIDKEGIKCLVKDSSSKEEFTSPIQKIYQPKSEDKPGEELIILTENSIYIVSSSIKKFRINIDDYN
jgi:hypothetical protein